MSFFSLLLLSAGLAMDAMAASAVQGLASPQFRIRQALLCALFFGGFQALMPLLGYAVGSWVGPWIARFDYWLAFVLLTGLGVKMLYESRKHEQVPEPEEADVRMLLILAIATSIDALLVGITLPAMKASLAITVSMIGAVTALLSFIGVWAGRHLNQALGGKADAFGGFVLIALGTKTLLERL